MLDLSHPMTQYVFQASALMDGLMFRGQRMSVSPSSIRVELLAECQPLFAELQELARAQFSQKAMYITAAIDEYESAIHTLAGLGDGQIAEDRRDGTGHCPICGTAITSYPEYHLVMCSECDKPFMAAHLKLDSSEGFATWAI